MSNLKEMKAKCRKCYTCEQGVASDVTREMLLKMEGERCKKCYTCEQGIASDKTLADVEKERKEKCKKCYTCQQGVGEEVTVNSQKSKGVALRQTRAEQCRKCYTCEQGIDKNITADDMKGKPPADMRYTWYLFPTNACNLRCSYCYAHNKPGRMTKAKMHEMLNWLFIRQPYTNINCHFFGGEPTVMWDMMVDIVQLGNVMAKDNKKVVTWSMTTNGTLLDEERLVRLKEKFRGFLLSIDGRPDTHNKYRVLEGGEPTHDLIPVDRILEMFPNLEIRPTINPDTAKDWFEDFRWLRNKGFKSIAVEPNFEIDWSEEQLYDFEKMLRQLGKYWQYAREAGQPFRMKFMDEVLNGIRASKAPDGRMCGVAFNCSAIDHRGMIYPCQRYASYNEPSKYAIGDVVNGFDEYKLFETQSLHRSQVMGDISKGYNCDTCDIRMYCHKGCNAASKKFMGRRDIAMPMYCKLGQIEIRVGLEVLSACGLLGAKGEQNGKHTCGK
jgi:uncharacterized protein